MSGGWDVVALGFDRGIVFRKKEAIEWALGMGSGKSNHAPIRLLMWI